MDPTIIVAFVSGISSIAVAVISKPQSNSTNSSHSEENLKSTSRTIDTKQSYNDLTKTAKKNFYDNFFFPYIYIYIPPFIYFLPIRKRDKNRHNLSVD